MAADDTQRTHGINAMGTRTPVRPSSSDRAPLASATNSLNWSTGSASAGTTPLKGFRTRARPLQNDFCERLAGMSIGSTTAPSFAILQDEETAASTPSSLRSESPRSRDKASDTAESTTTSVESATIPANGPLPDSPKTSEQVVLAISGRVTDLLMAIQEISTVIFEIQELRHTTTSSEGHDAEVGNSAPGKAVDEMLARLETKLQDVNADFTTVETQVRGVLDALVDDPRGEMEFLRQKWTDAVSDWDGVQTDAEQLAEELKEDKWLVVFRTVSTQADDMQQSLEKALSQCELFVEDAKPHLDNRNNETSLSDAKRQHLLATCRSLAKSLEAKVKYYSPACVRVLNILGKGIADRSTTNGEVMRRYGEMKTRWKSVQERIDLVAQDLDAVEQALDAQDLTQRSRQSAASLAATLTPPRATTSWNGRLTTGKQPGLGLVSPPSRPLSPQTPNRGGPMQQSTASPTLATLDSLAIPDQDQESLKGPKPTPPRPPKSTKRLASDSFAQPPHDSHTPLLAVTPRPASHRRSISALSASVGQTPCSLGPSRESRRQSLRPISPMPPAASLGDRPRWNASLKPPTANSSTPSVTPARNRSGRTSAIGTGRAPSRMSLGSSIGPSVRAASPAFSDASSVVTRERPGTPSRIPRPSSGGRRRSSVFGTEHPLDFDRPVSPPGTMQRPHSSARYSLSRSVGPGSMASPSRTRTTSARTPSRPISPALSAASSGYRRGTTPEPSLMAQTQRIAGPRSSSVASRPPPVPRMPSSYRQSTTNEAGLLSPSRLRTPRPPSAAGLYGLDRSMTPLPGHPAPQEYRPNPHDPLDCAVADIANSMPVLLDVVRVELPLSRAQAAQLELFQARYSFGHPSRHLSDSRKAVMCKLVDRVGARAKKGEKKVLARVGGGWQELEVYMLSLIANNC